MIPASIIISLFLNVFIPYEYHNRGNLENTAVHHISKVLLDLQLFSEYTYNNSDLISEEKSKFQYVKHHYNDKNQLLSSDYYVDNSIASNNSYIAAAASKRKEWVNPENSAKSYSRLYEYNDKGLVKSTDQSGYYLYAYDRKNRISRQIYYHENKISGYIDYTYDRKGNVIKMSQYDVSVSGNPRLISMYEYEFDNKYNPYQSFKSLMIPGKNTNVNNITKEIYTVISMGKEKQIKEFTYEYNDKGYPIRVNKTMEYFYY